MKIPRLTAEERERIRWVKQNTTPEQRMDWLVAAGEFARAKKKVRKAHS